MKKLSKMKRVLALAMSVCMLLTSMALAEESAVLERDVIGSLHQRRALQH